MEFTDVGGSPFGSCEGLGEDVFVQAGSESGFGEVAVSDDAVSFEGKVGLWPVRVLGHDLELGAVLQDRVSKVFEAIVVEAYGLEQPDLTVSKSASICEGLALGSHFVVNVTWTQEVVFRVYL